MHHDSSIPETSQRRSIFERACSWSVQVGAILAGMSGLFVRNLTPLRGFVTIATLGVWLALTLTGFQPTESLAYAAFAALYVLRYAFLFFSFTRWGLAPWLRARLGKERGFSIYEAVTALFFSARGLSFAWLLQSTHISVDVASSTALVVLGAVCALAGTAINVWAAHVIGMGTYYYRDLFMGDVVVDFKVEGPYRIWRNPMYGVGQLAGYGAALMALSPLGVLASALNQFTMYLFNTVIEQPHLENAMSN